MNALPGSITHLADGYSTYIVHLVITDNAQLNNNGARPTHEVFMQVDASTSYTATRAVVEWHRATFGPMTVKQMGTREGTLARS